MERLLAVWVETLAIEDAAGVKLRAFGALLDELAVLCPFVDAVRPGLITLPMRGPSRFYGGESVVLEHVAATVERSIGAPGEFGVGDGLFTAFAAARRRALLAPGESEVFRRALPVGSLERRELATVCKRLGLHTLGSFADLAPARVAERFSRDAVHAHRVARGEESELAGQRDERLRTRLRAARGEAEPSSAQRGFFGDHLDADRRAAAAAVRVRQRLGPGGVVTAAVRGGRSPLARAALWPFGAPGVVAAGADAPWPAALPAPSPATILSTPIAVRVLDDRGANVVVDPRGSLSAIPREVRFDGRRARAIEWFAGPWPVSERWWSAGSRRAHLQVVADGAALWLFVERGAWFLAGIYD